MITQVARLYHFRGIHHVPGLPAPWCEPHEHDYTVEVVAQGLGSGLVVDTDKIDVAWGSVSPGYALIVDLDAIYGPEQTTVEALANRWLEDLSAIVPEIRSVRVWEDDERWGSASRQPDAE